MSSYLNIGNDLFFDNLNSKIYVDKTMLIKETNNLIRTNNKFMCITRPRRFGKTMALSMLNAYYSKGCDSRELFKDLKFSKDDSFETHLNKHNVIWIDMGDVYTSIRNKNDFFNELETNLIDNLNEEFPGCLTKKENTVGKALIKINQTLNERFIFLIDEWDVIYREQENNFKLCNLNFS